MMIKWQPISTAPRGPDVLLFAGIAAVGEGFFDSHIKRREGDGQGAWCWAFERRCDPQPTHWMPLPEPPAAP